MLILLAALTSLAQPAVSGSWVIDEADEVVQARHTKALDEAMASLPWAFRPIAKPFLKGTVRSCDALTLDLEATSFHAKCDDRPPIDLNLEAGESRVRRRRRRRVQGGDHHHGRRLPGQLPL